MSPSLHQRPGCPTAPTLPVQPVLTPGSSPPPGRPCLHYNRVKWPSRLSLGVEGCFHCTPACGARTLNVTPVEVSGLQTGLPQHCQHHPHILQARGHIPACQDRKVRIRPLCPQACAVSVGIATGLSPRGTLLSKTSPALQRTNVRPHLITSRHVTSHPPPGPSPVPGTQRSCPG